MTEKKSFDLKINLVVFIVLVGVVLAGVVVSLVINSLTGYALDKKSAQYAEEQRPANLNIIVLTDSSCNDCFDPDSFVKVIEAENVNFISKRTVEINSNEGQKLLSKFNIIKAPTVIISGEIEKNQKLKSLWSKLGNIKENSFVLRQIGAPYVLVSTGEIKGRAKLIMLTDKSCGECYNVNTHEQIMAQFGFPVANDEVFDVGLPAGQSLMKKYDIKLVPTIIITGDVNEYPALVKVWPSVGTVEDDGAYVFREGVKQMGVYRDLVSGQVIKPASNNQ